MEKKEEKRLEWYNNPSMVTNIIIGLIVLNVLLSQSFAIKNGLSVGNMLTSILSHNSVYLLAAIYFICLKTKVGKKYFNFLNLFLILVYLLTSLTSLLTVIQSFNLGSVISLCIQLFIVLYLVHTFFRGTHIWKEFKFNKSPFNEFSNDGYYYTIMILAVILLAVNLILTTSFHGTILALLDCSFTLLFSRYIYLYWQYLDDKKIDSKNNGNFDKIVDKVEDEVKETIEDVKEVVQGASETISNKFDEIVDVDKISKAVVAANDKIVDFGDAIKDKVEDFVEDNNIDDKIDDVKEKVIEFGKDVKEKVEDYELDEKVDKAKDKVEDIVEKDSKENKKEKKKGDK